MKVFYYFLFTVNEYSKEIGFLVDLMVKTPLNRVGVWVLIAIYWLVIIWNVLRKY